MENCVVRIVPSMVQLVLFSSCLIRKPFVPSSSVGSQETQMTLKTNCFAMRTFKTHKKVSTKINNIFVGKKLNASGLNVGPIYDLKKNVLMTG